MDKKNRNVEANNVPVVDSVKISELNETLFLNENDVIPVVQNGETKKFKSKVLHGLKTRVVDNLTTGGKDYALSAEQGKLLGNRVKDIEDLTPVWQNQIGTGNIIINDGFEGTTKDLVVKGKTKRYQEAEIITGDNSISFENGISGTTKGLTIKGQTLYNLSTFHRSQVLVRENDTFYNPSGMGISGGLLYNLPFIQSGKDYTIVYTVIKNIKNASITIDSADNYGFNSKSLISTQGTHKVLISSKVNATQTMCKIGVFKSSTEEVMVKDLILDKNIMLLEGDWTNKEIPTYFDSIMSSAESEGNKLIAKSVGKNLLNPTKCVDGFFYNTDINLAKKDFPCFEMKIKKNVSYVADFKCSTGAYGCILDFNRNYIKNPSITNIGNGVMRFSSDIDGILLLRPNSKYDELPYKDIEGFKQSCQVEEGTIASSYEAYREDKLEIQLPHSNKKLKSVQNEYYGETGIYVEKVGEVILNPDMQTLRRNTDFTPGEGYSGFNYTISDEIPNFKASQSESNIIHNFGGFIENGSKRRGLSFHPNGNGKIIIESSVVAAGDINAMREYMRSNPIKILYELSESVVHNIDKASLNTYNGITHMTLENNIPCSEMKAIYPITKTEIDAYKNQFDSIVSSAEQEGNKLIVKSCGKNLFDYKSLPFQDNIGGYNDRNLKQIPNGFRVETLWATSLPLTINLGLKAGKTYTSSYNLKIIEESLGAKDTGGCKIVLRKGSIGNYTYLYLSGINGSNWTFKCPDDIDDYTHLMFYSHGGGGSYNGIVEITNFQLEEGTLASKYEPYVEDKKEILLTGVIGGHKGLPNIQNMYNGETGKYEENVFKLTKVILRAEVGSYSHSILDTHTDYIGFAITRVFDKVGKTGEKGISNLGIVSSLIDTLNCLNDINLTVYDTNVLYGSIKKSLLQTPDLEGVKNYFNEKTLEIVYALKEPIVHNIDKMALNQYDGTTHIIQENEVVGDISCNAKISLSAQNNRIKAINEELKIENEKLKESSVYLHNKGIHLTSNDLELDFRIMELEFALDIPINLNKNNIIKKGVVDMAATPYEMMKTVVLGGTYDRADYEYKISVYVKRGRMTQDEADELIALMDAKELV